MTLCLAALSLLIPQERIPGGTPIRLTGCVFATADPEVAKRARSEFRTDEDIAKLALRFPEPRFYVQPWGTQYGIVIDRESGPLGAYRDRHILLGLLQNKVGRDRLIRLDGLSPEETNALGNVLTSRSFDPQTHKQIVPTALGIYVRTNMIVERNGEKRTVWLESGDSQRRMMDALASERRAAIASEENRQPPSPLPDVTPRDEVAFIALGRGHALDECLQRVAPILSDLCVQAKQKESQAAEKVLGKLDGADAQHKDEILRREVSAEQWKRFGDDFISNWRGRFDSEDNARRYFDGCTSIRFTTSVGLEQMFDPGDPSQYRAGSGGVQLLYSVPGFYSP